MKLRQLRYVLAIVDNRLNVTAAADRLYTSQPGVSKQIILLEQELGVHLFERKGRSFRRVTASGEQVVARARAIMQEVEDIRAICRGLADDDPGLGRNRQPPAPPGRPPLNAAAPPGTARSISGWALRRLPSTEP